jgi:hypothetical protein
MNSKKNSKEINLKQRTTTILNNVKFGLQKKEKEIQNLSYNLKFKEEMQRTNSLELCPENVHQKKLKTQEIK